MEKNHFLGIDVSKEVLDVVYKSDNDHFQVENTQNGYKAIVKWVKKKKIPLSECWFVFEFTGLYCNPLANFFYENNIRYTQVPALAIQRSLGIIRGKNDKLDAKRIAEYAYQKREQLTPSNHLNESLQKIKNLLSLRSKLVVQKGGYVSSAREQMRFWQLSKSDLLIKSQEAIIKAFDKQIKNIEKELLSIIQSDEGLAKNYKLLRSIPGVGFVLAFYTLVYTNNFTNFSNGRQFASYCGTAPFEHTSGSSIRGKTRISSLANKKMKTLLDLSAKAVINSKSELGQYYHKRIAAGKNKMSTVNILRNKIIHRMFAVINRQQPYSNLLAA